MKKLTLRRPSFKNSKTGVNYHKQIAIGFNVFSFRIICLRIPDRQENKTMCLLASYSENLRLFEYVTVFVHCSSRYLVAMTLQ